MRIFFEPTSLFQTLLILAMLAGGIGLIARAARGLGTPGDGRDRPAAG